MDKVVLEINDNVFWNIGKVYKNGKLIANINKFYEVTKDFIYIYDTAGGSDSIKKGELIRKIYIGDCEFEKR